MTPDRGRQAERTAMAWTRTTLAVAASGVLVLLRDHGVGVDLRPARVAFGGYALLTAAVIYALGTRRRRRLTAAANVRDTGLGSDMAPVGTAILLLVATIVIYLVIPYE